MIMKEIGIEIYSSSMIEEIQNQAREVEMILRKYVYIDEIAEIYKR